MSFGLNLPLGSGNHFLKADTLRGNKVIAGLVCSLGGTAFGYDLGALSAVSQNLRSQFSLGPSAFGLTISASLWGTVLGSMFAGYLAIYLGRRGLIASCALTYATVSATVAALGTTEWQVLLMRFLCGVAIGGLTVGCPLYLADIAPTARRGHFVAWFQVQVGVGLVLGFTTGYLLARSMPAALYWRACLGLGAVPPILLLLFLKQMPSEAKLFLHAEEQPRTAAATWAYNKERATDMPAGGYGKLFRRENLRPLLLATSIALFNQLSGVNVLLLYLLDVLSNAGADLLQSHRYTLLIASLGLGTTLCGMALVDNVGRKPLLISGAAGMSICLFVLSATLAHHLNLAECWSILVVYNACFAFSYGTVIWVYLSELFPFDVRAKGQSYGVSVHWVANAILIAIFPTLQRFPLEWSFRFFGLMMVLQIMVALIWYPETKGLRIRHEPEVPLRKVP